MEEGVYAGTAWRRERFKSGYSSFSRINHCEANVDVRCLSFSSLVSVHGRLYLTLIFTLPKAMDAKTIISFSAPYRLKDLGKDGNAGDEAPIFKVRVASSTEHLDQASNLIREKYQWRGYESGGLVAHPYYVTLLVSSGQDLIGTMTFGIDSVDGLALDVSYKAEADLLRASERQIAEITKFAVENKSFFKQVIASLIHIVFIFAYYIYKRTDFLIEVHPKHVEFYESRLGFRKVGEQKRCDRVNAPVFLMQLDLSHMKEQIERFGGTGRRFFPQNEKTLYPYFFSKHDELGVASRILAQPWVGSAP